MKRTLSLKKTMPLVISIFCLLLPGLQNLSAERFVVRFDQLAPTTVLQEVLDCCLQVQNEFIVCLQQKVIKKQDINLFVDMIIGKLFHLQFCVKQLSSERDRVHVEDLQYVLKTVKEIEKGYKCLKKQTLSFQAIHIKTLLDVIESELLAFEQEVKANRYP